MNEDYKYLERVRVLPRIKSNKNKSSQRMIFSTLAFVTIISVAYSAYILFGNKYTASADDDPYKNSRVIRSNNIGIRIDKDNNILSKITSNVYPDTHTEYKDVYIAVPEVVKQSLIQKYKDEQTNLNNNDLQKDIDLNIQKNRDQNEEIINFDQLPEEIKEKAKYDIDHPNGDNYHSYKYSEPYEVPNSAGEQETHKITKKYTIITKTISDGQGHKTILQDKIYKKGYYPKYKYKHKKGDDDSFNKYIQRI